MAINKVVYGGNTLLDLTGDTLETAGQLLSGVKAHARNGTQLNGTFAGQAKSVTPSTSAQNITPDAGKYLSNVTVGAIPSNFVDINSLLIYCTNGNYNSDDYVGSGQTLANVTITVGFQPKIIIFRNVDAVYNASTSTSSNFILLFAASVYATNNQQHRSGFILYDGQNMRARGGQSSTNYFEPTSNGFKGVGTAAKLYAGTYHWNAWG